MSELNIALIGCGGIGATHLARWSQVSGARIAAVCDQDAAVALRVAAEYEAEPHTSWKSLLENGRQRGLDIVDICTPPDQHAPIALYALDHGLHVLCEKPLARGADEARQMVERAEQRGRLLMTAFCHRFHPPILFARELIDNDDLGRITMFRCRFSSFFEGVEERWFSDPAIAGGGALLDTAVHAIDLFRYLVGEVTTVTGRIATVNPKLSVEDSAAFVLGSEKGALGVVEVSWATPGGRNALELYGTAGACLIDYDLGQVRFKTADMAVWETREIGGDDRFMREILHFADAARGLQPLVATGFDGLRANEIVDALYAQSRPQ